MPSLQPSYILRTNDDHRGRTGSRGAGVRFISELLSSHMRVFVGQEVLGQPHAVDVDLVLPDVHAAEGGVLYT